MLTVNAYLTWFERKVVAHMQSRWGPHRVGPHGLLQPLADGAKFLLKEDPTPAGVDKFIYFLAPLMALATGADVDCGHSVWAGANSYFWARTFGWASPILSIGLLVLFAITAMGVYGVALAGWSSNSNIRCWAGCAVRRR